MLYSSPHAYKQQNYRCLKPDRATTLCNSEENYFLYFFWQIIVVFKNEKIYYT